MYLAMPANKAAAQVVFNDPIVQSQFLGRGTVTIIMTTLGPAGASLHAVALAGGALRTSSAASDANVSDMLQGAFGVK